MKTNKELLRFRSRAATAEASFYHIRQMRSGFKRQKLENGKNAYWTGSS